MKLLFLTVLVLTGIVYVNTVFAQTKTSDELVVLHTGEGNMIIELFPNDAPKTVQNFLELSKNKFYDGTRFHRIIKDFMIQGGDPNSKDTKLFMQWGYGGTGSLIPSEFNDIMHKRGIVSMARNNDPNSASSQFFIVHKDSQFLDQKYTVFGRLVTQESFDTLDKIAELETTGPKTNYLPKDLSKSQIQKVEVVNRADVDNLMTLGEPMRLTPPTEEKKSYSNKDLGISFDTVSTWDIQTAQTHDPTRADISLIGPKEGDYAPRVLIFVSNSTLSSLDEFSNEIKELYAPSIKNGQLTITSEEKATINKREALIRNSIGKYNTGSDVIDLQYRETVFKSNDKFYTITYANTVNNFEKSLPKYEQILGSLAMPESKDQSGCLVATAVFGSELAPQVQLLREVRDNVLFNTNSGTAFMIQFNEFYYALSPTVADWERQNPLFKETVKITITPMLSTMSILNHADIHSEQQMLGYGIGVILLNIGMYFVVPAIVLIKARKFFK